MRIFVFLLMAVVFIPTGYFASGFLDELTDTIEQRQERDRSNRTRIMRVLKSDQRFTFQQVVVGPGETEQELVFRARAYRDGIGQAAYGSIRTECPPPATEASCWELAALHVDGVAVDQPGGTPDPEPIESPPPAIAVAAPVPENLPADIPTIVSEPEPEEVQAPTGDEAEAPPEPAAAPRPTHLVRPNRVNARDAPQGTALTTLPRGTPLIILEQQAGWGRFEVLDGTETGSEVWIALSVLDPL